MEEDNIIRFTLRLPRELHDRISASADRNNRSVTAEMVSLLGTGLEKTKEKEPEQGLLGELLPPSLLWRVRRYQERIGIKTPEDASKRLIRSALDEKESVTDILDKLHESYKKEKDLRVLAQDSVAGHTAIKQIEYGREHVWFLGNNDESGAIDRDGRLYHGPHGAAWDCGMDYYSPKNVFQKEYIPKNIGKKNNLSKNKNKEEEFDTWIDSITNNKK